MPNRVKCLAGIQNGSSFTRHAYDVALVIYPHLQKKKKKKPRGEALYRSGSVAAFNMALNNDIDHLVLYRTLPIWAHGYIFPFVLLYALLFSGWMYAFEGLVHLEVFFICVATIGALDILACLACVWSVHVRCFMTYKKVSFL